MAEMNQDTTGATWRQLIAAKGKLTAAHSQVERDATRKEIASLESRYQREIEHAAAAKASRAEAELHATDEARRAQRQAELESRLKQKYRNAFTGTTAEFDKVWAASLRAEALHADMQQRMTDQQRALRDQLRSWA